MWFLILLAACGSDPVPPPLPEPIQQAMARALPPDLAAGRLAYREHCQTCHGQHARGDGPAAAALSIPDLAALTRDQDWIQRTVHSGVGGTAMQPFAKTIEEQEIEAIARWVASLEAE